MWAHQCHLLGGKRLSGEFVCISHRLLLLVKGETGSGGLWTKTRVCQRLLPSGRGELSPVTLPFGRSDSACLAEIKSDSEPARGKSVGRLEGRGWRGRVCVPWGGRAQRGPQTWPIGMPAAPAKPKALLRGVLSHRTRSMKL